MGAGKKKKKEQGGENAVVQKMPAGQKKRHGKKAPLFAAGGIVVLLAGGAIGYHLVQNGEQEVSYREDAVQYGELTVGLQETGSVEVGTTEQLFELDMSAYTESGDGGFSWEQGGANGNIFQGMTAGSSVSSSSRSLVVEEVLITEGQEVSEGDPLYLISQDSIDEIREELTSDMADAQVTLEQTQTQLAMTRLEAQQKYETDTAYGDVLAQAEYDNTIRQLQEAGIRDIYVVTGYLGQQFDYLRERAGVSLIENKEYQVRNNHSSVWAARDVLANTYICSSDNYFTENLFTDAAKRPYYSALYADGPTEEYCLTTDSSGRITDVTIGGSDSWYMLGHVYFDREFSRKFLAILEQEYDLPETRDLLWEKIYMKHLSELSMYIRKYPSGVIHEFDTLEDLRQFDPSWNT